MEAFTNEKTIPFSLKRTVQGRRNTRERRRVLKLPIASFKKRGFDLAVSGLVTLGVLIWLLPIVALLIKLTSRGPVLLFRYERAAGEKCFHA